MTTGTAIKCNREAESHGGPLRKDGVGYICEECWAKEHDIKPKKPKGREVICPWCDKVLMTKFRGGKVSITSLNMKGSTATITCDCGFEKVIKNPFGGKPQNRDEAAFMRMRAESQRRKEEADNGNPRDKGPAGGHTDED